MLQSIRMDSGSDREIGEQISSSSRGCYIHLRVNTSPRSNWKLFPESITVVNSIKSGCIKLLLLCCTKCNEYRKQPCRIHRLLPPLTDKQILKGANYDINADSNINGQYLPIPKQSKYRQFIFTILEPRKWLYT